MQKDSKLNSRQLRRSRLGESVKKSAALNRNPLVIVLDNVQDTYNIGSFFRLADALAARELILCGSVVTPPNLKIHRASIGTWKFLPWRHFIRTAEAVAELKKSGYQIIAVEQGYQSRSYLKAPYQPPLALILGNEASGLSAEIIKQADLTVEIPLHGINKSLNVLIAAAVIGYHILGR